MLKKSAERNEIWRNVKMYKSKPTIQ